VQKNIVPFGVKHAVIPPPMASPDVVYSHANQRGVWDQGELGKLSTFGATTYRTDGGDSGSDEAH